MYTFWIYYDCHRRRTSTTASADRTHTHILFTFQTIVKLKEISPGILFWKLNLEYILCSLQNFKRRKLFSTAKLFGLWTSFYTFFYCSRHIFKYVLNFLKMFVIISRNNISFGTVWEFLKVIQKNLNENRKANEYRNGNR